MPQDEQPTAPNAAFPFDRASEPSAAVDAEAAHAAADAAQDPTEPARKRIAVIMAHPDDPEFVCAGTVATWAAAGHEITYVLVTSGDKGSDDPAMTPERLAEIREAEQRAACAILGVQDVIFLRYPDGMVVPDLGLRRDLARVIRRLKPDVVLCDDPTVRWADQSYINHPDHMAVAEATLAALFPAARARLYFPELLDEGLEPHKVTEVYVAGGREPDVWVDISGCIERKLAALRAHASQLGDWDPEEMIRTWARETAQRNPNGPAGGYAESFKYFKLE